jgi:hypothetical protein
MKPSIDVSMPCSGKIVEILLAVCNMFARESWEWVMFALIYLRSIGRIISHWILSRSSCKDFLQNFNIISMLYKSFFDVLYHG